MLFAKCLQRVPWVSHTCTNHTVPYGTALLGGAFPGTSCQATIAPSLRDTSQQALARYAKRGGNFVLVVSGSLEADGTNQLIEIVYDLLIEAIQLGSLGCFEFGVSAVGLK